MLNPGLNIIKTVLPRHACLWGWWWVFSFVYSILKAFVDDELAPAFALSAAPWIWYIDFIASFCVTCWAFTQLVQRNKLSVTLSESAAGKFSCYMGLPYRPAVVSSIFIFYFLFFLCIQDLEGGQESLLSHLIETSLHYLTSLTTSHLIYAGYTFLNYVVISNFKIIYFWLLIKKNNSLMEFFFSFSILISSETWNMYCDVYMPVRHWACLVTGVKRASIQAWI